jgi:hypothetical protein
MTNSNYKSLMTSVYTKLHTDAGYKGSELSVWSMTIEELLAVNFSPVSSVNKVNDKYLAKETVNKLSIHI